MHSTGSVLLTLTEKVRFYIDDPDLDAKYDDNYMVRFLFPGVMEEILSRVAMMADNPIRLRHTITLVKGQETYILPPTVRMIFRVAEHDDQGFVISEARPRGEFNPRGPGWQIQGNELIIRPFPQVDNRDIDISYIPTGDVLPVYVNNGGGLDATSKIFTFSSTAGDIQVGGHDRRPLAYEGALLRMLALAEPLEERVIQTHDQMAGTATVRTAFTAGITTGDSLRQYEIIPFLLETMLEAVAIRCAMKAGVGRKISQAHRATLIQEYGSAVKTAFDNTASLQGRMPDRFDDDTVDTEQPRLPRSLIGTSA